MAGRRRCNLSGMLGVRNVTLMVADGQHAWKNSQNRACARTKSGYEIDAMTPDEQRIAIATDRGWAHAHVEPYAFPDYYRSLDAIIPAIRELPQLLQDRVICFLARHWRGFHSFSLATPAQWCEAYLRAKGLWKALNETAP